MLKHLTLFSLLILIAIVPYAVGQDVPPAPANLTVEQVEHGAKLQWDPVRGAFGYRVYKAVDTLPFLRIAQINTNRYIDERIPANHVFRYYVTAFNSDGESLPSNDVTFTPSVITPCPRPHGVIDGKIIDDSTETGIGGVLLTFFKTNGQHYFRNDRTDSLGYYSMHIDTGSYYVYAFKKQYIPEWYDNSLKREYATPVHIAMGDTATADFGLTRIPPPPQLKAYVRGMVTDDSTNLPIEGAFVVMMRSNHHVHTMDHYDGSAYGNREETFDVPGIGRMRGIVRITRTDAEGKYTLRAPIGTTYIMLAFKQGYIPEFWKEKTNPFDANRIFLRGDTNGIDFTLTLNPAVQNSLAGEVKSEEGFGVMSKLVLFKISRFGVLPVRCAVSDSLGSYTFKYLHAGYYFLKVVPFGEYAPAWYSKDSCGSIGWKNADVIHVEGNTTGIDVCVKPVVFGGFASVKGTVRDAGTSSPMQAVTVYTVDPTSGMIVNYDITENDGTFEIAGMAPGKYEIVVDKEGYITDGGRLLTVDDSNNFALDDIDLNLNSMPLDTDNETAEVPSGYTLEQNYPNPFNPSTEIVFGLPADSRVKLTVFNMLGQHVATVASGVMSAGTYNIPWDGKDFSGTAVASGIYFYKISAEAVNNTMHFSQVRKMVLMK